MVETERKFLIQGSYKDLSVKKKEIRQAFLNSDPDRSVRVRIADKEAYLTIKGKLKNDGMSRFEFEKEISYSEAIQLMQIAESDPIEKTRHYITFNKHMIEVDEFHGKNSGLILAEIEISLKEELTDLPEWIGEEVTGDLKYYNVFLSQKPYTEW